MRKYLSKVATSMGLGRMSEGEYRANLNGINMFFGAVLGVVLAGIEKLNSFEFGFVLLVLAGIVTSIMFISGSRNRVMYSAYALAMSLVAPRLIDTVLRTTDALPPKVVPTVVAWTLMTIAVEFWGRDKSMPGDSL